MKRLLLLPLLILLILGGTAGSKALKSLGRDHLTVDGVKLKHKREIELKGKLDDFLEIESALGDIEIHGIPGSRARLRIEIYEYKPGDIEVELTQDGSIILESEGRHPGAIGNVYAEVPNRLDLEIETGLGDVSISDFIGDGSIDVDTGLGAVILKDITNYRRLDIDTGKGDIYLGPVEDLEIVDLDTGMGAIKVKEAKVEEISASTGMGSIRFLDCDFDYVSGGTGMGSVKFRRTHYRESDISSGFGRVSDD
ncbi:MAG: DUF4097 family beta strand repeat protein [bacterium]|nr:DUF4097 family beta strand repeat protein [bacterium]